MGENYGVSFAHKLNEQGLHDQAIAAANQEIARDAEDPEPLIERAVALAAQEKYLDAVKDLERALELDEEAQVLEVDFVDDVLFGALLGEARRVGNAGSGERILARYAALMPSGRHLGDVDVWTKRLRGENADAVIVKERLVGDA